jgi:hypothetical protein
MKIAVVVQQWPAVLNAPGADQEIDGLANGNAAPAQAAEIASCSNGNGFAPHLNELETAQQSLDRSRRSLALEALQYLTTTSGRPR